MNLDLLTLNLKSKSKYTTPRAPIKTHLVIEKKPKLYSTPNSAKKSRFVPPIAIPISDLDDFEEKSDRKSSHIKFLTEQRDYSTPRSIQTFVLYRNGDLKYSESATKIQRCWRAYKKRKRFRKFVNFISEMRRKTLNFAIHMWLLSLKKPANISKNSYEQVVTHMKNRGYIIRQEKSSQLITKDHLYNVNDFFFTMGTDFLFLQPQYPPKIIKRFQCNFYYPFIQSIFSSWLSLALEKIALRKTSRPMQELAKKRSLFGPMFWTFYFWRRWAKFKKTKQIPRKSKGELFVTEWSIFIGKKKHQFKLNKAAEKLHHRFIKSVVVSQLRIKSANRSVYNKAFDNFQKIHNESLMLLSLRAFNVMIATKQFNQNIKRRVIRSWYKVIDLQIISRMKEKVLKYRGFLKCLKNSFKKWQNYVIDEGIRKVYLHDLVIQNNLLLLKTFFLLKSDFPHFAFVAAFLSWKKLIEMNHNKRRFIFWSTTKAKPKVTLQSLLYLLKENAALRKSYDNFHPFVDKMKQSSQNELIELYRSSASAKNAHRKKLIKAMKKISDNLPPVKVFTTSVDQTIYAYKNLNEYEMIDKDWYKTMASNDVKDLFYRLIIILTKKPQHIPKTSKEKIEILKRFRSDNLLYNANEIRGYKVHQDRQDNQRQNLLSQILKRDLSLFMAFDTHEAAISLHNISNKFVINQIPIEDVTSLKPKTKKTNKNSIEKENQNQNKIELKNKNFKNFQRQTIPGRNPKEVNPDHPLLRPIESVKKSIDTNNRKYRRSPEEIFEAKESSSTLHNIRLINKLASTSSQAKFQLDSSYENFTPLNQSLRATRMMSSREFLLKELSDMHDNATTELERINENDEYEIYSKEDLENLKDEDLFEKEIILPSIDEIPTIYNTSIKTSPSLNDKLKEAFKNNNNSSDSKLIENETNNNNDESNDDNDFNKDITISDLSKNFLNDSGYFEYTDSERAAMLSNKYLRVLELLIDDSLSKPEPHKFSPETEKNDSIESENDQIRSRISYLLHKVVPIHKKSKKVSIPPSALKTTPTKSSQVSTSKKQKKKVLFNDPDQQFETIVASDGVKYMKSKCPEFNNVAFNGTTVLTNRPWETEIEKQSVSSSSSSAKKLRKKKRRRRRSSSIDGFESSDDDENENDDEEDDTEFNTTSLPKPTFKVPGFDDNEPSSPISPPSSPLFDQINSFLSSSYSTVDDQEHLIEKLRQEASSSSNNSEEMRRTLMLLVDAVAHKYVLKQLDTNSSQLNISSLVDVDGMNSKEVTSDDAESFNTIVIQKKLQKNKYYQSKKFAAFGTDSRLVDPPEIIERKFTFTKDLLNAIAENAKFASTLKMKYYKDVSKMKPFEGMKLLAKKVREKLNKTHIVQSSASYDENKNEVCLSIGGISNKKLSKNKKIKKLPQSRPSTPNSEVSNKSKISKNNHEIFKLEINSRPRTPLLDGCAKPEPGGKKIVKRPIVMKRKPQFTKMTPSNPFQPPEFHVAKEFNDDFEKVSNANQNLKNKTEVLSGPPAKLKWNLNSDRINITNDDIEFFMFVTPYVMPPEILYDILEKQNKTI